MIPPEDSMEEIKPQKVSPLMGGDQVDRLFSQGITLSNDCTLHEPTCMICSSAAREEVEQKYLETKNYGVSIKLFNDRTGIEISKSVMENHMKFHYDRAIRQLQMLEYVDRIKRYSGQNLTTLDRIAAGFAIISERLMGINSITPSEDESVAQIEKIKSSETSRLMGQLKDLLTIQAKILGEMKNTGELISIPTAGFIHVFNDALADAKTDKERKLVKGILDRLELLGQKA